jgi:pimeloyl-ACP methyl ester carboxylesterase
MCRRLCAGLAMAIAVALAGCAGIGKTGVEVGQVPSAAERVVTETFMVPSADPGIQLHVRNKRPAGMQRFASNRTVLFVHGATYPAETGFDIDLPGGSWMDNIARRGFDVYLLDVRGYGRSTRPAVMSQPASANPPFADTADAVRDVGAAVDFIRKRRGIDKLSLIGWSWGTAIMGTYTAANNAKVERLVLYAPLYSMRQAPTIGGIGAYRTVSREVARQRGVRDIPAGLVEEISPRAWFDKWFDANLATDPVGAAQTPPVVRAPNGVIKDIAAYWAQGKSPYDPADIRVPTLVIVGEWDQDTPLYMAQEVFAKLGNSPDKRYIVLREGTHAIALEKNRLNLIREVQQFLEN